MTIGSSLVTRETVSADGSAVTSNLIVSSAVRDVLYTAKPLSRTGQVIRETVSATRPTAQEIALAQVQTVREVLYRPIAWKQAGVIRDVLYDAGTVPTIHAVYNATFQNVIQETSYAAPSVTISTEQILAFWHQAIGKVSDTGMPASYTTWSSNWSLAVSRLPITTASYETVPSLWSMAAQDAPVTQYPPAQFMASVTDLSTLWQLTVISLVNAYVPTSGIWSNSNWNLAIQSTPDMAIWISDDFLRTLWMKVIQKRTAEFLPHSDDFLGSVQTEVIQRSPMVMPASYVAFGEYLVQAVAAYPATEFPISPITMNSFGEMVLQGSSMGVPAGPQLVASYRELVTQSAPYTTPAGPIQASQIVVKAMQGTMYTDAVSTSSLSTTRILATQDADYDSTDSYLTKARMVTERLLVAQDTEYVFSPSASRLAAILDLKIQAAPTDFYPDPDTIYQQSKFTKLISYSFQSVQSNPHALPASFITTPSYRILALQDTTYASPEEMANSGSFVYGISQFLASAAVYETPTGAASPVQVFQVVENAVSHAEFPDKDSAQSYNNVTQVVQSVTSVESWTPWPDLHAPLLVNQVVNTVASASDYGDPYEIHSPVTALAVAEQTASVSSYPDKDIPQSVAQVYGVSQSLVQSISYPDKDIPQSFGKVHFLAQQLVSKDTKLYGLPATPRRHRIRVVCNVIYE